MVLQWHQNRYWTYPIISIKVFIPPPKLLYLPNTNFWLRPCSWLGTPFRCNNKKTFIATRKWIKHYFRWSSCCAVAPEHAINIQLQTTQACRLQQQACSPRSCIIYQHKDTRYKLISRVPVTHSPLFHQLVLCTTRYWPVSTVRFKAAVTNAQYTPPTPTRRNCRVESRRRRRCVLGLTQHSGVQASTGPHLEFCRNLEVIFTAEITSVGLPNLVNIS